MDAKDAARSVLAFTGGWDATTHSSSTGGPAVPANSAASACVGDTGVKSGPARPGLSGDSARCGRAAVAGARPVGLSTRSAASAMLPEPWGRMGEAAEPGLAKTARRACLADIGSDTGDNSSSFRTEPAQSTPGISGSSDAVANRDGAFIALTRACMPVPLAASSPTALCSRSSARQQQQQQRQRQRQRQQQP
jgi:hypothetical protein